MAEQAEPPRARTGKMEVEMNDLMAKHGLEGIAEDIEAASRPCMLGKPLLRGVTPPPWGRTAPSRCGTSRPLGPGP